MPDPFYTTLGFAKRRLRERAEALEDQALEENDRYRAVRLAQISQACRSAELALAELLLDAGTYLRDETAKAEYRR